MALYSLLQTTDTMYRDQELGINIENYADKNFIIGFDLSASGQSCGESFDLPNTRDTNLTFKLSKPLPHAMTMIVYAEYDAEIEIDANGNVKKHDFAV